MNAVATPVAAADLRGGSNNPETAAAAAPAISLAELQALSAFMAPQQAGALSPVLALAPLYALRSAKGIDAVYAMPAGEAVEGMMDTLAHLLTVEMQAAAAAVIGRLNLALDPQKLRARLIAAMPKAA